MELLMQRIAWTLLLCCFRICVASDYVESSSVLRPHIAPGPATITPAPSQAKRQERTDTVTVLANRAYRSHTNVLMRCMDIVVFEGDPDLEASCSALMFTLPVTNTPTHTPPPGVIAITSSGFPILAVPPCCEFLKEYGGISTTITPIWIYWPETINITSSMTVTDHGTMLVTDWGSSTVSDYGYMTITAGMYETITDFGSMTITDYKSMTIIDYHTMRVLQFPMSTIIFYGSPWSTRITDYKTSTHTEYNYELPHPTDVPDQTITSPMADTAATPTAPTDLPTLPVPGFPVAPSGFPMNPPDFPMDPVDFPIDPPDFPIDPPDFPMEPPPMFTMPPCPSRPRTAMRRDLPVSTSHAGGHNYTRSIRPTDTGGGEDDNGLLLPTSALGCDNRPVNTQSSLDMIAPSILSEFAECGTVKVLVTEDPEPCPECETKFFFLCPTVLPQMMLLTQAEETTTNTQFIFNWVTVLARKELPEPQTSPSAAESPEHTGLLSANNPTRTKTPRSTGNSKLPMVTDPPTASRNSNLPGLGPRPSPGGNPPSDGNRPNAPGEISPNIPGDNSPNAPGDLDPPNRHNPNGPGGDNSPGENTSAFPGSNPVRWPGKDSAHSLNGQPNSSGTLDATKTRIPDLLLPGLVAPADLRITLPDGQVLEPGSSTTFNGHVIVFEANADAVTIDGVAVDDFYAVEITIPNSNGVSLPLWAVPLPGGANMLFAPTHILDELSLSVTPDGGGFVIQESITVRISRTGLPVAMPTVVSISAISTPVATASVSPNAESNLTVLLPDGRVATVTGVSIGGPTTEMEHFEGKAAGRLQLHSIRVRLFLFTLLTFAIL